MYYGSRGKLWKITLATTLILILIFIYLYPPELIEEFKTKVSGVKVSIPLGETIKRIFILSVTLLILAILIPLAFEILGELAVVSSIFVFSFYFAFYIDPVMLAM